MKKLNLIVFITILIFGFGCGSDKDKKNETNSDSTQTEEIQRKENCKFTPDMFNTFLGIKFGATMEDVKKILGEPSETSVDGEITTLKYSSVEGIPLLIWVNTTLNKVETIRLEVLGIGKYLDEDINNAISEYKIDQCVSSIIGQSRKSVEEKFGRPYKAEIDAGNDVLDYYNQASNIQITFKFYKEQDLKLTQINLNWYYD